MRTLLSVSLVLVLAFALVHARETDRTAVRPMRPVLEGEFEGNDIFTIDQGIRDRLTAAQVDTYCIVRYDFEQMDWQGWTREESPYSGLAVGLADKDPCNHNLSTQVVFFIGSPYPSAEYPGLFDTPFCEGSGGIEPPCQDEQVVSPVIDITRYSANCDEIQDAAIPPGVLPDLGGARLAFTVYADLPIVNLVFYRWAVRNITDGCPGPWLDRNYLYYSDDPVYRFAVEEIGDLLTADSVQVALGIVDMCPYWYGIYGDCAEHTPAPWFDNVSIRRYATIGPQWSCRPIDLFQDNFPGSEDIESWVRADMAADINPGGDPEIRPGDSIVVDCASPTGGGIAEDGGGPRVYMHVRCSYIGTMWPPEAVKPDLAGPELEGTYGHYVSDDGTWTIIQGDTAVSYAGVPVPGRYMFDLNDSLLTRGYMIEYYFKAYDNIGNSTTLPPDAESAPSHYMFSASHLFEFTCLPLLGSGMLYVDDYDGIGCRDGVVQVYFDRIISAMDENSWYYCIPERYDINGPTSLVSNGLASRARLSHLLDGYGAIIWDSGDLASGTITDGSLDKCDDCSLLDEWLDGLQRDLYGIWILGTDVADELTVLGSPQALALMGDWCGVTSEHGSYFELTGGYGGGGVVNPKVTAVPYDPYINPFWHTTWGDSIYAFGGCPGIRSFDVLGATANGLPVLKYPAFGGEERYAAIAATDTNTLGFEVKTMWFGFSFMHMRDCWEEHASIPSMSTLMYREVMRGHINIGCSPIDITHHDDVPVINALLQNHPNPFNPVTTIRFSLARPGHASLVIYDVTGRRVRTLVDGYHGAGAHTVNWNGANDRGTHVASGVYFYRLKAAGFEETRKMVLLR